MFRLRTTSVANALRENFILREIKSSNAKNSRPILKDCLSQLDTSHLTEGFQLIHLTFCTYYNLDGGGGLKLEVMFMSRRRQMMVSFSGLIGQLQSMKPKV